MSGELIFEGVKYISSKQAASITGYAKDYVGQLCRDEKVDAKLIGRSWYVSEESILDHKNGKHKQTTDGTPVHIHKLHDREVDADNIDAADEVSVKLKVLEATDDKEKQKHARLSDISSTLAAEDGVRPARKANNIAIFDTHTILTHTGDEKISDGEEASTIINTPKNTGTKTVSPIAKNESSVSQSVVASKTLRAESLSRIERERREKQQAMLANSEIHYEDGAPMYFTDDMPLFPQLQKKHKSRHDEIHDIQGTGSVKLNFGANLQSSSEKTVDVKKSKGKSSKADVSLSGYALMLSMLTIALVGAVTLFFIERRTVVGNSTEVHQESIFERFSIRKDFGVPQDATTTKEQDEDQVATPVGTSF